MDQTYCRIASVLGHFPVYNRLITFRTSTIVIYLFSKYTFMSNCGMAVFRISCKQAAGDIKCYKM